MIYNMLLVGIIFIVFSFVLWKLIRIQFKPLVNLDGKVVFISGASSGLGRECAFAFCKRRCHLVLCSRRVDELMSLKEKLLVFSESINFSAHIEVLPLDISNFDAIEKPLSKTLQLFAGQIDILVNNAGISYRGNFESTNVDVYTKIMNVNFLGHVAITKTILPYMLLQKGGHIVGIGSVQGKIAQPHRAPYAASKHACQAFYDSLYAELSKDNILVTMVNPGYIRTNLSVNAITGDGSRYGLMDTNTASGLSPMVVAERIVEAIQWREREVMLAPFHHRMAVWMRLICPYLYFWIMKKRALQ